MANSFFEEVQQIRPSGETNSDMVKQFLYPGVMFNINARVRVAVAHEELFDAKRTGGMA